MTNEQQRYKSNNPLTLPQHETTPYGKKIVPGETRWNDFANIVRSYGYDVIEFDLPTRRDVDFVPQRGLIARSEKLIISATATANGLLEGGFIDGAINVRGINAGDYRSKIVEVFNANWEQYPTNPETTPAGFSVGLGPHWSETLNTILTRFRSRLVAPSDPPEIA